MSIQLTPSAAHGGRAPLRIRTTRPLFANPVARLVLGGCVLLAGEAAATGATGGAWELASSPAPRFEVSGWVRGAAVQTDNRTVIAGLFTTVDGVRRNGLARLNPDGSLDESFEVKAPVILQEMYDTVAVDAAGRILVGGQPFFLADPADFQSARQYLVRLLPDGTLDTTFDAGAFPSGGLDGPVLAIVVQPDGKIVIGGDFTQIHGVARSRLARLNEDGSVDPTFDPGAGANAQVSSLARLPDGRLLVGGHFTTFDGQVRGGVALVGTDGGLEDGFGASGANGPVNAVAVLADGRFVVGGAFSTFAGEGLQGLALLDAAGNPVPGLKTGFLHEVTAVLPRPDGTFLVGGWNPVMYFNGKPTDHDAELLVYGADGQVKGSLQFEGERTDVLTLARRPDGKEFCGGSFRAVAIVEGEPIIYRHGACLVDEFARLDAGFTPTIALAGMVNDLVVEPGGTFLAGGFFNLVNGVVHTNLARIRADGTLAPGLQPPYGLETVEQIARQADGRVVLATGAGGVRRLMPDGTTDAGFQRGNVWALAVTLDAQGRILAGGKADATVPGIVRLLADGTPDPTFDVGDGLSNAVQQDGRLDEIHEIQALDDGAILVVGSFEQFNNQPRNRVVRLLESGAVDPGFVPPPFGTSLPPSLFRPELHTAHVLPDGRVLVGGRFSKVGDADAPMLARLQADGSLDATFQSPFTDNGGAVRALLPLPGGGLLVGGNFQVFDGPDFFNGLVQILPDGARDPAFTGSLNGDAWDDLGARALALDATGAILVGGAFSLANGQARACFAAYAESGPALRLTRAPDNGLELRWPAGEPGVFIETAPSPLGPWERLAVTPEQQGGDNVVSIVPEGTGGFFRMGMQP
ncbi:MAG: hypothetical protein D6766_03450 [Verrucomicrobia bacterium]|nr:MAG: hypothetical protein D6766_03450 [Verrucomicrobiota bacterium]